MLVGTTQLDRWNVLAFIWALRAITPFSFIHLLLALLVPNYPLREFHVVSGYALVECTFFVCVYLPRKRRLQKPANHPPPTSSAERRELVLRCISNIADMDTFFEGWHLESMSKDRTLCRDNVIEWLLWGFFSSGPKALEEPAITHEVEEYLGLYEEALGRKFPPGRNPGVKGIRLTLDDVVIYHRPVLWYLIVCVIDIGTAFALWWSGFKHYSAPIPVFPPRPYTIFSNRSPASRLSYWYRPANSTGETRSLLDYPPLVFLQGIGIGLFPYAPLLIGYSKQHVDVPIIVPEILSISSRITRPPLRHADFQTELKKIFDHHGIREYSLAAHSYGTVLASGIIRASNVNKSSSSRSNLDQRSEVEIVTSASVSHPEPELSLSEPSSVTLLDPIPILLHLPAVARNFLYRPPQRGNEHELYYFACTDPDVAHALSRHFFWTHNILWKEDLALVGPRNDFKPKVAVVLSGEDIVVDAPAVWTYLTNLPPPPNKLQPARPFVPPVPYPDSFQPTICETSPNVMAVYLGGLDHAQMFLRTGSWRGIIAIIDRVSGPIPSG